MTNDDVLKMIDAQIAGLQAAREGMKMLNKAEIHEILRDASLEKACDMANSLALKAFYGGAEGEVRELSEDLHYLLEYLRLNFDLVAKR